MDSLVLFMNLPLCLEMTTVACPMNVSIGDVEELSLCFKGYAG